MSNNENILFLVNKTTGFGKNKKTLAVFVFRTRDAARIYARDANKKQRKKAYTQVRYAVSKATWGPEQ